LRHGYFALVKPLTIDPDSTCRWQATSIIGEFIETDPERVWQVARELGKSPKADIRMASSTVLLEHLLEHHSDRMTRLFRAELERGDPRFADAVASCWNFGNSRTEQSIQEIIDEANSRRSNKALQPTSRPRHGTQLKRRPARV
jgi:hypothetical protein